jgi:hypothetical protein
MREPKCSTAGIALNNSGVVTCHKAGTSGNKLFNNQTSNPNLIQNQSVVLLTGTRQCGSHSE